MFTFLLGSFSRSRLFKDVSLKLVSLYQQEWSKWPGATSSRFRNLFERSANKETTAAVSMPTRPGGERHTHVTGATEGRATG